MLEQLYMELNSECGWHVHIQNHYHLEAPVSHTHICGVCEAWCGYVFLVTNNNYVHWWWTLVGTQTDGWGYFDFLGFHFPTHCRCKTLQSVPVPYCKLGMPRYMYLSCHVMEFYDTILQLHVIKRMCLYLHRNEIGA